MVDFAGCLESTLPSTWCHFPVPEEAKQPQSITKPPSMLQCSQGVVFSVFFILPPLDINWIHGLKSSFYFITLQNTISKHLWLIYVVLSILRRQCFFAFGSVMVYLQEFGCGALHPLVKWKLSTCCTKSYCRSFEVTQGFLTTCLLMNLVAVIEEIV